MQIDRSMGIRKLARLSLVALGFLCLTAAVATAAPASEKNLPNALQTKASSPERRGSPARKADSPQYASFQPGKALLVGGADRKYFGSGKRASLLKDLATNAVVRPAGLAVLSETQLLVASGPLACPLKCGDVCCPHWESSRLISFHFDSEQAVWKTKDLASILDLRKVKHLVTETPLTALVQAKGGISRVRFTQLGPEIEIDHVETVLSSEKAQALGLPPIKTASSFALTPDRKLVISYYYDDCLYRVPIDPAQQTEENTELLIEGLTRSEDEDDGADPGGRASNEEGEPGTESDDDDGASDAAHVEFADFEPQGVAVDRSGAIYVVETALRRIIRIDEDGSSETFLDGAMWPVPGFLPNSVALSDGNLFVAGGFATNKKATIVCIPLGDPKSARVVAGVTRGSGALNDNNVDALQLELSAVRQFSIMPNGDLAVADRAPNSLGRIRIVENSQSARKGPYSTLPLAPRRTAAKPTRARTPQLSRTEEMAEVERLLADIVGGHTPARSKEKNVSPLAKAKRKPKAAAVEGGGAKKQARPSAPKPVAKSPTANSPVSPVMKGPTAKSPVSPVTKGPRANSPVSPAKKKKPPKHKRKASPVAISDVPPELDSDADWLVVKPVARRRGEDAGGEADQDAADESAEGSWLSIGDLERRTLFGRHFGTFALNFTSMFDITWAQHRGKHAFEDAAAEIVQVLSSSDLVQAPVEIAQKVEGRFTFRASLVKRLARCLAVESGLDPAVQWSWRDGDRDRIILHIRDIRLLVKSPNIWRALGPKVRDALRQTNGRTGFSVNQQGQLQGNYGLTVSLALGKLESPGIATVFPGGLRSTGLLAFDAPAEERKLFRLTSPPVVQRVLIEQVFPENTAVAYAEEVDPVERNDAGQNRHPRSILDPGAAAFFPRGLL